MAFETNFAQHPTPQKFPPAGDTLSHTFFPESALFVILIYNKKKIPTPPLFYRVLWSHYYWKRANIVPVHKKGNKRYVENYRPISILSLISKVLERCVLRNARDHLLTKLNCFQHGFIPENHVQPNY